MLYEKKKSEPIALFTHEFFPKKGGIAICVEEVAQAACEAGYAVTVYAPLDNKAGELRSFPFDIKSLPNKGTHDISCIWSTLRVLLRDKLILEKGHVMLAEPGPILAMMLGQFLYGLNFPRLSLFLHGSEILRFKRNCILRYAFGRLLKKTHQVVVLSSYCKNLLIEAFPEVKNRVKIVPGALRRSFVPQLRNANTEAGAENKLLTILTVARIHPRKGQLEVVKALASFPEDLRRQVVYKLVGPVIRVSYLKEIEELAARSGFILQYKGELADEDLSAIYANASVFAMTSLPVKNSIEGFGLSYLEAQACGLPVVAYDAGGVADALLPGKSGIIMPAGDVEGLSAVLMDLLLNSTKRQQMGLAGREFSQMHSWRNWVSEVFG